MSSSSPTPSNPFEHRLSDRESWELGAELAALAQAGVPLTSGLRATADELHSPRVSSALRSLADELERGRPIVEILRQGRFAVPRYFLALVTAGVKTNSLGDVLQDFTEYRRTSEDQWRSVRSSLAYPLIVLALATAIFVGVIVWVVPQMETTFIDLDVHGKIPLATKLLIWLSKSGLFWIGGTLATLVLVWALLRLVGGSWFTNWFLSAVPFVGPMWRLTHWTQFCRLVAVLVQNRIPLPEALRLAADAARDESLAHESRELARRTEQGEPFSDALADFRHFPPTLRPVVRFGESTGSLAMALRTAGDMYAARLELQTRLVRVVAGPITFLAVALIASGVIGALVYPLITLIRTLSGTS